MSDYEKLKNIIEEIDSLIKQRVNSSSTSFITWKNKAELLINHCFGTNSLEYSKFEEISYYHIDFAELNGFSPAGNHIAECIKGLEIARGLLESFLEEINKDDVASDTIPISTNPLDFQKIFIVHGHDSALKESIARIIEKQGIEAIILSEQANQGRTIIEKFEDYSDVGGAICLFTADDVGNVKTADEYNPRARQNVVFEAGYFIGKLGRDHIVILADQGVEMPSDLSGVVYSDTGNWQFDLLKELNAMGYTVDANKLLK